MNSFLKITIRTLSLVFTISLSACEKDALLSPTTPNAESFNSSGEVAVQTIIPTIPKKYTLTKMGDYELLYQADGKLAKVQKGDNYVTYEYLTSPSRIIAYSWHPNGNGFEMYKKHMIDFYYGTNQAMRSEIWFKSNTTGNFVKAISLFYTYDNQHRLIKCNNEEDPYSEKSTLFTYNNEGDLTSVTVQNAVTLYYTDQYTYGGRGEQQDDQYPQNPSFTFFGEGTYVSMFNKGFDEGRELLFLPIFGKFHKHLVKTINRTQNAPYKILFNYAFKYDLNADGYVTKRERWNQTINLPVATELYQYKVETLTLQPQ